MLRERANRGLGVWLLGAGVTWIAVAEASADCGFEMPSDDYATGRAPESVAVGDLDGDLDLDLAVANAGSGDLSILLNTRYGTFAAPVSYGTSGAPRSVTVGDLDGDLDLELAVLAAWGPCRLTDDCLSAPLGDEGSHVFSTERTTDDGPDLPEACDEGRGLIFRRDVWFRYRASCTGVATASVCDSSFDTRLAVYAYSKTECPGSLLACGDDGCGENATRSLVSFPVEAGQTYLVRIGARFAVGEGTLLIECAE